MRDHPQWLSLVPFGWIVVCGYGINSVWLGGLCAFCSVYAWIKLGLP